MGLGCELMGLPGQIKVKLKNMIEKVGKGIFEMYYKLVQGHFDFEINNQQFNQ